MGCVGIIRILTSIGISVIGISSSFDMRFITSLISSITGTNKSSSSSSSSFSESP